MSAQSDPDRVGIMIKRRGSWRETVAFYGAYKDLGPQCVARFDVLVAAGMVEPWAALKALDDHCCADIIVGNQVSSIKQVSTIN